MTITILGFFILDRILKAFFLLQPAKNFRFLFFRFFLYKNEKILWGLIPLNLLVTSFSLIILFCLIYWLIHLWRQGHFFSFFAGSLIFVGALSNLIDRLHHGFVIDYIFWPLNYFNLADLIILVGVIILLIKIVSKGKS